MGHPKIGIPYGKYPRLLLSWLVTEAVRTKNQELILGHTLTQFMDKLDLIPTGGSTGTITALRKQMRRLFSSSIFCVNTDLHDKRICETGLGLNIAKGYQLWWDAKNLDQPSLWESKVILGSDFFNEIIDRPVPIDIRALKALKDSSMALDLYCWLTYRFSYLKRRIEIPWMLLSRQFGSNYADNRQCRYQFKAKLLEQLKKVITIYDVSEKINIGDRGLILSPGHPHIKKLLNKQSKVM